MLTLSASGFAPHQLVTDPAELVTFEIDAGFDRGRPDAVFYPESAADVSRVVQWARANGLPIVARGAGTGLSGGAVAERGGVIVEFARMKRIVELNPVGRNGIVQTGVVNLTLDAAAKRLGFYYPPDPSSGRSSVIGGNLGENAGGPHCFKYGVTTNYITGVEAILADGRVIRTGGQAYDYPELDLTGLIVGSEGTLALVTEAAIRLIRNPPAVKTMMVSFASDEVAGAAVSSIIAAGLVPATLEMMDQKVMGMIEAYVQVGLPVDAQAALIVEVDGYAESLDSQVEEIADILSAHGGYDLRIAQSEEERQGIWYGRKSAAGAFSRLAPAFYLVDVTVPRSFLAEALREIGQVLARHELETGHVFHAGDGNLHPCILCDPKDTAQMERVLPPRMRSWRSASPRMAASPASMASASRSAPTCRPCTARRSWRPCATSSWPSTPTGCSTPAKCCPTNCRPSRTQRPRRSTATCWRPRPPRRRPPCWLVAPQPDRRYASPRLPGDLLNRPTRVRPASCSPRTS